MREHGVLLAVALVIWGNAAYAILGPTAALPGGSALLAVAGVALVAVLLAVGRIERLSPASVVGDARLAARGAAVGAVAGAALAAASVAGLRLIVPLITGVPLAYEPLTDITLLELARHVLVLLPLGVIVPEELAFRGTLLALVRRDHAVRTAVIVCAAAFAAWHVMVIAGTIALTTLAGTIWAMPAGAIAMLAVFSGGLLFAVLRIQSATIATPLAAHWTFNGVILFALWWIART